MGITGAHVLLYTSEPDAVRAVLRDVFGWQGWGVTSTIVLPGGVDVMLYEPRHPTAI